MNTVTLDIIAYHRSPFGEKFGAPRQPGLAPAVVSQLVLEPPYNRAEALEGLDEVSHLWLEFVFDRVKPESTKLSVRPPRLGGNQKLGVFATRSTHRPSRLGLSVVAMDHVDKEKGIIHIKGADLIDGTPIVDIKPYVPYSDARPEAYNEIADKAPELIKVDVCPNVLYLADQVPGGLEAIKQILAQDPRPAFHNDTRSYTFSYGEFELTFMHDADQAVNRLTAIEGRKPNGTIP